MIRISAFVLLAALVGCSSQSGQQGAQGPGKEAVLQEVGGLIRSASGETSRGPQKPTVVAGNVPRDWVPNAPARP